MSEPVMTPKVYKRSISILFPPTCILCGAAGRDTMDLCSGWLPRRPAPQHSPLPPLRLAPCRDRPPAECAAPASADDVWPLCLAEQRGSSIPDEIVLVGAHYDSVLGKG